MSLVTLNEFLNILMMVTSFLLVLFSYSKIKYTKQARFIFMYLLLGVVVDSITFYFYKIKNQNSYWLTPFYFLQFFVLLSFAFRSFLNEYYQKKAMVFLIFLGIFLLICRYFFFDYINNYDNIAWFFIQLYYVVLCLVFFYFQTKFTKSTLYRNSFFIFTLAVFINCLMPLLSNLLQYSLYETSPVYFTYALLIINISGIIANLLIFRAIQFLTPISTPKP